MHPDMWAFGKRINRWAVLAETVNAYHTCYISVRTVHLEKLFFSLSLIWSQVLSLWSFFCPVHWQGASAGARDHALQETILHAFTTEKAAQNVIIMLNYFLKTCTFSLIYLVSQNENNRLIHNTWNYCNTFYFIESRLNQKLFVMKKLK